MKIGAPGGGEPTYDVVRDSVSLAAACGPEAASASCSWPLQTRIVDK